MKAHAVSSWLKELHRQWEKIRGAKWRSYDRPFDRGWEDLLDSAGLVGADEHLAAEAEARKLEEEGKLKLVRKHKTRHAQIKKVVLPLGEEQWLMQLMGRASPAEVMGNCMEVLQRWQRMGHALLPESWENLCGGLQKAFLEGRNVRPFSWKQPESLEWLLRSLHGLTSREWLGGTDLRDVSCRLGWESKELEMHRRAVEAGLTLLYGELMPLEALGLVGSRSQVLVQGPLFIHFDDRPPHDTDSLIGATTLSLADLLQATHATTSAGRLLSIENMKSTFGNLCRANRQRDTLLLATSYPNAATLRLLKLLPLGLEHHHFGDTDVSGYAILRALRRQGSREVKPFLMDWQDSIGSRPLSEHDRRLLPSLLRDERLGDCRTHLENMSLAGRKGQFEQEGLGNPDLERWPFFKKCLAEEG